MMRLHHLCARRTTRPPAGVGSGGRFPPMRTGVRISPLPDGDCITPSLDWAVESAHSKQGAPLRAVETRELTKAFGPVHALRGVTLEVAEGESLVVFGPNGAGKTTLLKILATLMRPSGGLVRLFETDPHQDPQLRRRLGVVSHHSYLYGGLTGLENLQFAARAFGVPDPLTRAEALLEAVGLWERRHDAVRTYSRGMTQRLSIARALVHDPALLLLDEPFTGLDRHAAGVLVRLLDQMRGSRTVVLTTHSIEQGLALCDRAAILIDGRVAYEGADGVPDARAVERIYADFVGATA